MANIAGTAPLSPKMLASSGGSLHYTYGPIPNVHEPARYSFYVLIDMRAVLVRSIQTRTAEVSRNRFASLPNGHLPVAICAYTYGRISPPHCPHVRLPGGISLVSRSPDFSTALT